MQRVDWIGYAWAVGATVLCTAAGLAMVPRFDLVNVAMLYMLAVVFVALRHERGPAIAAAILCVCAFDVLFVPPLGAFTVDDAQYLFTFAIMLVVALVISALKRSVRRRSEAESALALQAEAERVRSTLLASISHDLRTPLSVMTGASSSLAERGESLPGEERIALARSLFEQSREMSERVAKILEMTRLEAGPIALERDWASPAEMAESSVRLLGERLSTHRLMVEVPPDLPLVRVDAALVEQAITNLLDNAAKHTPAGTPVRLCAAVAGAELVVSVEDYGPGIAADDIERVFAKFHRGNLESGGGMGLGLAICRAIVRLHGGRAWAERIDGGGTAFRFTLPLEAVPPAPVEPAG